MRTSRSRPTLAHVQPYRRTRGPSRRQQARDRSSKNAAERQGEGIGVAPYRPPVAGYPRRRYSGTTGAMPRALCEIALEA